MFALTLPLLAQAAEFGVGKKDKGFSIPGYTTGIGFGRRRLYGIGRAPERYKERPERYCNC